MKKRRSMILLLLILILCVSVLPSMNSGVAIQSKISGVAVTYFKPSQINTASTIILAVDINEYLPVHSWIKIIFPDEWTMPIIPLPNKNLSTADKKELERIITSLYLATSPCTSCQGYPYVRNLERDGENSIQFWTHLELKPDGPYDPIPITVASRAGFKNAKTPGFYQICVETEAETARVCSQDIEVVKSQIEAASVTLSNEAVDQTSGYNIKFKVGAGGSLDARRSKIRLRFPKGTKLPNTIEPTLIKVNEKPLSVDVNIHQPSASMSFVIPVDVAAFETIDIDIPKRAGIVNAEDPGMYQITIATTYEPTLVESLPFEIKREGQKPIVAPPYTHQIASYKFAVYIPNPIEKNDLIEINFPNGTTIPKFISSDSVLMNDAICQLKPRAIPDELKVQLYAPEALQKGSILVEFLEKAKIKNPKNPGDYTLSFKVQSSDEIFTTDIYKIFDKKTEIVNIKVTPLNADVIGTWEIEGSTSFNGDLKPGDTITLTFPEKTTIPDAITNSNITVNGLEVTAISISGRSISLTIASKIESGNKFTIVIAPGSGIRNPSEPSSKYKIIITTTVDQTANESVEFFIAPPLPITKLLINPPEPDGKNGWFIKAPAIDFDCTSNTASVYMWWNWKKEQAIKWTSDDWLPMADEQRIDTLYYYAEDTYGIEEVKEFEFKIDTVAPTFTITKPIGGSSDDSSESTYVIEGTADATELFIYDREEDSRKVVPEITIDGKHVDVIQPPELGLAETTKGEGNFSFTVDIDEGENTFVIRAEDKAGNFIEKTVTITKDTIAPTITITSPEPGMANHCDEIEVKGETEAGAIVVINGDFVPVEKDGTFTYDYYVDDLKQVRHDLTYSAEDIAGNTNGKKKYTIWFGTYSEIPTNGKDQPTVNGQKPKEDSAAYVSTKGKTMVPLRYLAVNLMGADVFWDKATKTARIENTIPPFNIYHKIGTTYFTKIVNGKTTRVDMPAPSEIKNDRTYLPMREFLEGGLGLIRDENVIWVSSTRTVIVKNPGNLDKCNN